MIAVLFCGLVNSGLLLGLLAGIIVGFVRARVEIAAALSHGRYDTGVTSPRLALRA